MARQSVAEVREENGVQLRTVVISLLCMAHVAFDAHSQGNGALLH